MNFLKLSVLRRLIAIILCFSISLYSSPKLAFAQPVTANVPATIDVTEHVFFSVNRLISMQYPSLAIFWLFRRKGRSRDGAPANPGSAGRRGPCYRLNRSFVALTPRYDNDSDNSTSSENPATTAVGFTSQVHPKVFVYLPDVSNSPLQTGTDEFSAQFMLQQLQNQDEVDVVERPIEISIPAREGIAALDLNELDVTLVPDQAYHWYLSIVCEPMRPSRNPSVDGWIEVINTDERQAIRIQDSAITAPWKKVEFYTEKELWHETMALLTELRCQEPENIQYKNELKKLLVDILFSSSGTEDESENEARNEIELEIAQKLERAVEEQYCPIELRPA